MSVLAVSSAGLGSVNVCYVHSSSVSLARDTITDDNDVVRPGTDEGHSIWLSDCRIWRPKGLHFPCSFDSFISYKSHSANAFKALLRPLI